MATRVSWESTAVSCVSSAVIRVFLPSIPAAQGYSSPLDLLTGTHLALEAQIWGVRGASHPAPLQEVRLHTLHLPGPWLGHRGQ